MYTRRSRTCAGVLIAATFAARDSHCCLAIFVRYWLNWLSRPVPTTSCDCAYRPVTRKNHNEFISFFCFGKFSKAQFTASEFGRGGIGERPVRHAELQRKLLLDKYISVTRIVAVESATRQEPRRYGRRMGTAARSKWAASGTYCCPRF